MRISQTLINLARLWKDGQGLALSHQLMKVKVPLALFQMLFETLQMQTADGFWEPRGPNYNDLPYATLTVATISCLSYAKVIESKVKESVFAACSHLQSTQTKETTKSSELYRLAAVKSKSALSADVRLYESSNSPLPLKDLEQYTKFFSRLPCCRTSESWEVTAAMMEGLLFMPKLQDCRIDMFDREGMKADGYLPFIAFTFTCANNLQPFRVNANILFDMMILTLRAYQLDEYVEHVIGKYFGSALEPVKALILRLFSDGKVGYGTEVNKSSLGLGEGSSNVLKVTKTLSAFIHSILLHPAVEKSSNYNRNLLKNELQQYLMSHITQLEDSQKFLTDGLVPFGSYNTWVRTTGAAHVFVTFSLAYLECLIPQTRNQQRTADEQYIIQDIWCHLAKKVRMENDHPSFARDQKEGNLNSLDFPEFRPTSDGIVDSAKGQLKRIILYEKQRCEKSLEILVGLGERMAAPVATLRFYYYLTDVVGDVYAARDISTMS